MSALSSYYLVFVAIHIAFMVTWFAGLFYLPRLFIYHAEASDLTSHQMRMAAEYKTRCTALPSRPTIARFNVRHGFPARVFES